MAEHRIPYWKECQYASINFQDSNLSADCLFSVKGVFLIAKQCRTNANSRLRIGECRDIREMHDAWPEPLDLKLKRRKSWKLKAIVVCPYPYVQQYCLRQNDQSQQPLDDWWVRKCFKGRKHASHEVLEELEISTTFVIWNKLHRKYSMRWKLEICLRLRYSRLSYHLGSSRCTTFFKKHYGRFSRDPCRVCQANQKLIWTKRMLSQEQK